MFAASRSVRDGLQITALEKHLESFEMMIARPSRNFLRTFFLLLAVAFIAGTLRAQDPREASPAQRVVAQGVEAQRGPLRNHVPSQVTLALHPCA
jgi:hypothetical protein